MQHPTSRAALAAVFAFALPAAHASCGSAFCTLMTDRYASGSAEAHAGWSTDLRFESVNQSRLWRGTRSIDASQVEGEEAIERHTRNRNLQATLAYGFNQQWSLSLHLPLVRRDHLHDLLDETTGDVAGSERWRFTKPGDLQVQLRRQFGDGAEPFSWAVTGGLKLPTGSTTVANGDGSRAERALQPGTGTTDGVLGAALRRPMGLHDALVFQAQATQALNSHRDFKPGSRFEAGAGWSHAFTHQVGSVMQLNVRQRGRDRGAEAEPDNSGSTAVDLSPGLTLGTGAASTVYAYLQVPLYRKVNGIQLVPRQAFALGWTADF